MADELTGRQKAGKIITDASQAFTSGLAASRGGAPAFRYDDTSSVRATQDAADKISKDLARPPLLKKYDDIDGSFKKGGRVKKTGLYRLHKNEVVVTARAAKREQKKRGSSRRSGR